MVFDKSLVVFLVAASVLLATPGSIKAQAKPDISIELKGCALAANRVTLSIKLTNNTAYRLYFAQVNDGNDAHGSSSSGDYLYILNISGAQTCHGETRNCLNNQIINDANQLSYIDSKASISTSTIFIDGNNAKVDPSDTASLPIALVVRKSKSQEEDVPDAALPPPGRPYVVRGGFSDVQLSQCR